MQIYFETHGELVTFERLSLREITQYLLSGHGPSELQTHLRFIKMVYTHDTEFGDAVIFGNGALD